MMVAIAQLSQGQGIHPSWDLIWEQSPAQLTPQVLGWLEIPAPSLSSLAGIPPGVHFSQEWRYCWENIETQGLGQASQPLLR